MNFAVVKVDASAANQLADNFREVIAEAGVTSNGVLLAAIALVLADMLTGEFEHLGPALQTIGGLATHLNEQKERKMN